MLNDLKKLSEKEFQIECPQEFHAYKKISQFYKEAEEQNKIEFYGILNCEVSPDWRNNCRALYSGIFRQKGERWLDYSIANTQFPTDEELTKLKGLVIGGASHSAYDESYPFHKELYKFLLRTSIEFPHLKVLGVCFGCQVLAHSLGGKAAKMQNLEKPVCKLENIKLKPELQELDFFKKTVDQLKMDKVDNFVVVEAHGDHVEYLPENAVVLAYSDSTKIEMWILENRILSVQFHPEFNPPLMKCKLIDEASEGNNEKKEEILTTFKESEQIYKFDPIFPISMCKNFLKT